MHARLQPPKPSILKKTSSTKSQLMIKSPNTGYSKDSARRICKLKDEIDKLNKRLKYIDEMKRKTELKTKNLLEAKKMHEIRKTNSSKSITDTSQNGSMNLYSHNAKVGSKSKFGYTKAAQKNNNNPGYKSAIKPKSSVLSNSKFHTPGTKLTNLTQNENSNINNVFDFSEQSSDSYLAKNQKPINIYKTINTKRTVNIKPTPLVKERSLYQITPINDESMISELEHELDKLRKIETDKLDQLLVVVNAKSTVEAKMVSEGLKVRT